MPNEPVTYSDDAILTVGEAARYLRIGTSTAYKLTQLKPDCPDHLPTMRIGRIVRIPFWALKLYVSRQSGVDVETTPASSWRGPSMRH